MFASMMALGFSNIIGGVMAQYDLRLTMYATVPFFVMIIPLTLTFHEPSLHKRVIEKGYSKKLIQSIYLSLLESKKLRWLIIYSSVIFVFNKAAFFLYQPYFAMSGLDVVYFGIVFAAFQVVSALASKYAHNIEKRLGEKYSLIMLIVLVIVSYFLMSNFVMLFSFSFGFIQHFSKGFKDVIITDYINKLTVSEMRATVLSVNSFFNRLVFALFIPVVGWIADVYNIVQALSMLALTSFFAGVVLIFFLWQRRVI